MRRAGIHGPITGPVRLSDDRALVGRGPDCDVRLDDNTVSSAHLEIARHGSALVATDLGSLNGTVLNGDSLFRPVRLADATHSPSAGAVYASASRPPPAQSARRPPRPR